MAFRRTWSSYGPPYPFGRWSSDRRHRFRYRCEYRYPYGYSDYSDTYRPRRYGYRCFCRRCQPCFVAVTVTVTVSTYFTATSGLTVTVTVTVAFAVPDAITVTDIVTATAAAFRLPLCYNFVCVVSGC